MIRTTSIATALAALFLASLPMAVEAQERAKRVPVEPGQARVTGDPLNTGYRGTVRVSPGGEFQGRGALWRLLLGDNWRNVWAGTIEVPVLDLQTYAGGLKPTKAGGNQTRTLHFAGGDGRRYVFRSVSKSVQRSLGDDLQNTFIGNVIQDQNSANHPSAATIADVVQDAAGVLHPSPTLVVLPDDAALGEFREIYANMLGHIEIKPDDVKEGVVSFGLADKIQDADKLLENLEESLENRFDARSYLKVRLLDAIMGDFDRGADQWDFARYDDDGIRTYVPIARDRDWAFMRSNGLLMRRVRHIYAKIGSYDPENEELRSITFMTHEFDRSHLVALPWSEWQAVVGEIMTTVTDDVVRAAVANQPPSFRTPSEAPIMRGLEARRTYLNDLAREFYEMVNGDADVFAADGNEQAVITRRDDGSLHVTLMRFKKDGSLATDEGFAFDRTFLPGETDEVRVYMMEGDDRAVVRGNGPDRITLRVIGGGGDDMLMDSTTSGRRVEFYDATGDNRFIKGANTHVHTRTYVTTQPSLLDDDKKPKPRAVNEERRGHFQDQWKIEGADFATQRTQSESTRFWGAKRSMRPSFDLRDGAGIVLGGVHASTSYGFRSEPFARRISAGLQYGASAQKFAASLDGEWHPQNRDYTLSLLARASGFEAQRFYGFGNDSPLLGQDESLVMRNDYIVQPSIFYHIGKRTDFEIGPVVHFVDPRPVTGSPAAAAGLLGTGVFGAVGARTVLHHSNVDHETVPGRGYRASLAASTFQAVENGDGAFGSAAGQLAAYIPLKWPTLALRVGGQHVSGEFPLHAAAMLGGRETLRGYRYNRFSGDASVFGNAELRVPVTRMELLVRGDLGLILMADAGRVWFDGDSPGGWHTSRGVGVSFASLSNAVSLVYAHGEEGRIYLNFGLPF